MVFNSAASDLVPGDTSAEADAFVRDRRRDVTVRVSLTETGEQPVRGRAVDASISADGRVVAVSTSTALTAQDTDGLWNDVYLRQLR